MNPTQQETASLSEEREHNAPELYDARSVEDALIGQEITDDIDLIRSVIHDVSEFASAGSYVEGLGKFQRALSKEDGQRAPEAEELVAAAVRLMQQEHQDQLGYLRQAAAETLARHPGLFSFLDTDGVSFVIEGILIEERQPGDVRVIINGQGYKLLTHPGEGSLLINPQALNAEQRALVEEHVRNNELPPI